MKVERSKSSRAGAREADKSGASKTAQDGPGIPFVEQLALARERTSREQLDRYLAELDEAGQRLAKNPTRENLDRYKAVLQGFMRGAVALMFHAEKRSVYHRRNGFETRVQMQIDAALVDLTEEVLQKNRRPIRILQRIGEIRGLLVDAIL